MYLVAIAWLYVAMMLSIGARSVTTGVLTFIFTGLLPCALILWLFGSPRRRRLRREDEQTDLQEPPQVHINTSVRDQAVQEKNAHRSREP